MLSRHRPGVRGNAPERPPDPLPAQIVLYDGVCGLCHRTVAWLLARDRERRLWFAPLQGETAARLRALHPDIPLDLDSVVLVDGGRVYLRAKAFLRGARYLGPPWAWASWFRWLPGPVLDPVYRLVARVRYRVWGRFDECRVPAAGDRSRFLP
jgi:predicted DCC family thiol-disulfide oxidoreductase YuxK